MKIEINKHIINVKLLDNSSAQALIDLLNTGPLTISMKDYGNVEKVGPLGKQSPRNDKYITTKPGDVILYEGHYLAIYHRPNSWNFTKIGEVEGLSESELRKVLGQGEVTVTLSIENKFYGGY